MLTRPLVALGRRVARLALFPAPRDPRVPVPTGAVLRETRASDGRRVRALHLPAPPGARTVVHFHGNGETIADNVANASALRARGLGVLCVEYRGYGPSASEGPPSEEGLYRDAEAALALLRSDGVTARDTVLWGTSLGTGVAAEMVVAGHGVALVLVTPFTSIPRVARRLVRFVPTGSLLLDRFDTLAKAPRIEVPTLVVHGDRDELVPYDMGVELARAIRDARLVTVPGGRHNDLFSRDGERLLDAIAAHARGI